ncbi:hypothetical protein VTK56DRAFT_1310 [Thermocarpiscus australiensis]
MPRPTTLATLFDEILPHQAGACQPCSANAAPCHYPWQILQARPWSLSCVAQVHTLASPKKLISPHWPPALFITDLTGDPPLLDQQSPCSLTNPIRYPCGCPSTTLTILAPTARLRLITTSQGGRRAFSSRLGSQPSCSCWSAPCTPERPRGPRPAHSRPSPLPDPPPPSTSAEVLDLPGDQSDPGHVPGHRAPTNTDGLRAPHPTSSTLPLACRSAHTQTTSD